jgi:hypothetical protein
MSVTVQKTAFFSSVYVFPVTGRDNEPEISNDPEGIKPKPLCP